MDSDDRDDPFSKETIDLPDEFDAPDEAVSSEDFITLSLKLIARDAVCSFNHWRNTMIVDGQAIPGDDGMGELFRIAKHLNQLLVGANMVLVTVIGSLDTPTRIQFIKETTEEKTGQPVEVEEIYDSAGNVIGAGLRFKDTGEVVDEVAEWLRGQG